MGNVGILGKNVYDGTGNLISGSTQVASSLSKLGSGFSDAISKG